MLNGRADQTSSNVAQTVKRARENSRLSQRKFADRIGWTQPRLSRHESGAVEFRYSELQTIAGALGFPNVDAMLASQTSPRVGGAEAGPSAPACPTVAGSVDTAAATSPGGTIGPTRKCVATKSPENSGTQSSGNPRSQSLVLGSNPGTPSQNPLVSAGNQGFTCLYMTRQAAKCCFGCQIRFTSVPFGRAVILADLNTWRTRGASSLPRPVRSPIENLGSIQLTEDTR